MGDPAERPARLKVGVIGAGRVGTVLGAALERAGDPVIAVSAVSDRSLERAGRMLPGAAVVRPPELLAAVDLALLTVPDDALPGLVSGLAATDRRSPGGCWCTPAAGTAPRCWSPRPCAGPSRSRCIRS